MSIETSSAALDECHRRQLTPLLHRNAAGVDIRDFFFSRHISKRLKASRLLSGAHNDWLVGRKVGNGHFMVGGLTNFPVEGTRCNQASHYGDPISISPCNDVTGAPDRCMGSVGKGAG